MKRESFLIFIILSGIVIISLGKRELVVLVMSAVGRAVLTLPVCVIGSLCLCDCGIPGHVLYYYE